MPNSITNRQMTFILIMTLTCYTIVTISKNMAKSAGTGSWITLMIAAIIFSIATMGIVYLNNRFPGKMLFEYAQELVTKPGAYLLAIYYILYFLFVVVFLITAKAKLLKGDFFPNTPLWAFPLIGLPVFCYVAYKGVTNVARLAEILGVVFVLSAIFIHILMITQGRVNRILPLFDAADIGYYVKALKNAAFPFLGVEILLAIPFTKQNGKKSIKTAFFTLIFVGLFYTLVVESCIMKVGINDIVNYNDSLIVAIRDTAPAGMDFFSRLDILYLTIGFSGMFMGISIVLMVIVEYVCRMFARASRLAVVITLGIVIYILFLLVSGIMGYEKFVEETATYLGLVASMLIPPALIAIAVIRKKGVKVK